MAARYEEIHLWLVVGKREGATHVIVACDTFDWSDYPVYVKPEQDVNEQVAKYNGKDMQKIMEVYNLAMDIDMQLKEHRAWNI